MTRYTTDVPTDQWVFLGEIFDDATSNCYWLAGDIQISCDRFGWISVEDAVPVGDCVRVRAWKDRTEESCTFWCGDGEAEMPSWVRSWMPDRGPEQ